MNNKSIPDKLSGQYRPLRCYTQESLHQLLFDVYWTLDITKALENVDHTVLLATAKVAGLPPEVITYLRDYH